MTLVSNSASPSIGVWADWRRKSFDATGKDIAENMNDERRKKAPGLAKVVQSVAQWVHDFNFEASQQGALDLIQKAKGSEEETGLPTRGHRAP